MEDLVTKAESGGYNDFPSGKGTSLPHPLEEPFAIEDCVAKIIGLTGFVHSCGLSDFLLREEFSPKSSLQIPSSTSTDGLIDDYTFEGTNPQLEEELSEKEQYSKNLPVSKHRDEILETVWNNPVVVMKLTLVPEKVRKCHNIF